MKVLDSYQTAKQQNKYLLLFTQIFVSQYCFKLQFMCENMKIYINLEKPCAIGKQVNVGMR